MRILAELIESAGQGIYPCLFHLVTGAYCPGCGGTRALLALLHGRLAVWMTALGAGIIILVMNFIIKNYFLLVRHVDLLALIY